MKQQIAGVTLHFPGHFIVDLPWSSISKVHLRQKTAKYKVKYLKLRQCVLVFIPWQNFTRQFNNYSLSLVLSCFVLNCLNKIL